MFVAVWSSSDLVNRLEWTWKKEPLMVTHSQLYIKKNTLRCGQNTSLHWIHDWGNQTKSIKHFNVLLFFFFSWKLASIIAASLLIIKVRFSLYFKVHILKPVSLNFPAWPPMVLSWRSAYSHWIMMHIYVYL
jgi:hypothetical protein